MRILISIILLLFALTGCSFSEGSEEKASAKKSEQKEATSGSVKKDVYVPNPQVSDDINLVKVGETVSDDKGEITLKEYKQVNKKIKVGSVEMLVKDVKVIHFVPDYSMIDFFHGYTHDEEFDFIKVAVETKNTSKEPVKFTPVAYLKMNSGEHKTWEDDIYLESLTGELGANSTKRGNMGFILDQTEDYQSVELLTSDAVNKQGKSITTAEKIVVEF
ncbi:MULTISPECIES: DUF4352 domain-containing protein [unclassified Bacillus (in: firmicutes)]|uniref:DUF4352 domain-containing protein n=1 Tax=unclassified Bacillus (in: firmicutes) TaxID=185979 RepID=UPI0008E21F39|nr:MULTISPECIES: DUF4352 domain-containing protein [unclassified Bacillus (in: firmicutes)]SFB13996.1 hypothetical protein SAMN02799634_106260 [Bacillus sp. UNCCL13]SFQ89839.1 hypothetical protein SAMN04488577_3559 [Bacillus sp. cl95]